MTAAIPYSESCERNKDPILNVISPFLKAADKVLEIGTGSAQHAVYFARAHAHLTWHTSDQKEYLEGIRAQLKSANLANVQMPVELNVNQQKWLHVPAQYPLIYTANTLHIMSESDVRSFFSGLQQVINNGTVLIIYGPFSYGGKFTSQGNIDFDASLRSSGTGSGIRDFELIKVLANKAGFSLLKDVAMPANNQTLIWKYHAG